jgi:hypothetical protein
MSKKNTNAELSTTVGGLANTMLGDAINKDELKLALDVMCFRNGANKIITEKGSHINHTNQYIIRIAKRFNIDLDVNIEQKKLDAKITLFNKMFPILTEEDFQCRCGKCKDEDYESNICSNCKNLIWY